MSFDTDTTGYPHYPRQWDHAAKVAFMIEDLRRRGISVYASAPPFFRFLWKIGLEVPPPLFLRSWINALLLGSVFGSLWYFCMAVAFFIPTGRPVVFLLMAPFGAAVGLLFGTIMAIYFGWKRRRLQLPRWQNYPADQSLLSEIDSSLQQPV